MFDRVVAGWNVTVLLAEDSDPRPLEILGATTADLESTLAANGSGRRPTTVAVAAALYRTDARVRQGVLDALGHGRTEVTMWGEGWPAELDRDVRLVQHRLSMAARAFKVQALAAAAMSVSSVDPAETFCTGQMSRRTVVADLLPAG
ncbi:hypothetical protein [Rhodococcus sp. NPDC003322]